jgi:hypothetical protein
MKSWSDSSRENNTIIEAGIFANAVFRRDKFLTSRGYQNPVHRCVFVDRDKLPLAWPIGENGQPLQMIGVVLDLDRYVGERIRVGKSDNIGGCGRSGILKYTDFGDGDSIDSPYGYSIDTDPDFYFGIAEVHSVSRFKDDEGTQIKVQLSIK